MTDGIPINPTSIGASNASVSHYVLSTEDLLAQVVQQLKRKVRYTDDDGTEKYLSVDEPAYSEACVAWMTSKVLQVINKNTYLSQIGKQESADEQVWEMHRMFLFELLARVEEFDLTPNKFMELAQMHFNYSYFGVMRALFSSDKKFLSTTTSETTQSVSQRITEEQKRKGFLSGLIR